MAALKPREDFTPRLPMDRGNTAVFSPGERTYELNEYGDDLAEVQRQSLRSRARGWKATALAVLQPLSIFFAGMLITGYGRWNGSSCVPQKSLVYCELQRFPLL